MISLFVSNTASDNVIVNNNGSSVTMFLTPPVVLDPNKKYTLSLVEADISNVNPNIISGVNSTFSYTWDNIQQTYHQFPTGLYSLDELQRQIDRYTQDDVNQAPLFKLEANTATSKIYIHYLSTRVKLNTNSYGNSDCVLKLLGFDNQSYIGPIDTAGDYFESDNKATLNNLTNILVNCNIIHGSFLNSKQGNVLASIMPDVEPYSMIQYRPNFLLKVPLTTHNISQLVVNLTDQNGNSISFMPDQNGINYEKWHVRLIIEEEK